MTTNVTVTQVQETAITVTDGAASTLVDVSETRSTLVQPDNNIVTLQQTTNTTLTQVGVDNTQVLVGQPETTSIKFNQVILATPGEDMPYDQLVDEDSVNGYIYIGLAVPGATSSTAAWRIQRIEFVDDGQGGEDVNKRWANGDATFSHIWDNRASLSY